MRGEGDEDSLMVLFKKARKFKHICPEQNREGNTQYSISILYFSNYAVAGD